MAELPEIDKISRQMNQTLPGKQIREIKILQPKCSNLSEGEFRVRTAGSETVSYTHLDVYKRQIFFRFVKAEEQACQFVWGFINLIKNTMSLHLNFMFLSVIW